MVAAVSDVLRHLEKDMADILDVITDMETTEIILNPFKQQDSTYVGYILVDQHNIGLHNLVRYYMQEQKLVTLNIGDQIVYKYSRNKPTQILFWVKLPKSLSEILYQLSLCIKNNFSNNCIIQSDDFAIQIFAKALYDGYINNELIINIPLIDEFINKINRYLPITAAFSLQYLVINSETNLAQFIAYPSQIRITELVKMSASRAETIMSVLASITNKYIHHKIPFLECQIPKYGHRFTGVIPPAVPFPAFCIRKHSPHIYTLNDLVEQGVLQSSSRDTLINWIKRKFNLLIAGGTGSGKTTLANALLYEINQIFPDTRVLIIEDVPELKFDCTRSLGLNIGEFFSMYDALRTSLRFKPDRIVMGEVRGAEAYTLLKAWNTGHPGGLATIHANGINEALYRFESCIRDHPNIKINRQEIGFTVNGIISIQNITIREEVNGEYINIVKRRVTGLRQIIAYDPDKDIYQDIVYDKLYEYLD